MPRFDDNFNPGAFAPRPDPRNYQYRSLMAMGAVPVEFDWAKGYDTETVYGFKLSESEQDGSQSCVGQSFASYGEVNNAIEEKNAIKMSARAIYSHIFLPNGGAYVDEGAKFVCKDGFFTEQDVPSYDNGNPPSEDFARHIQDITEEIRTRAMMYGSKNYYYINSDSIDDAALALKNHGAVILGATGSNEGWIIPGGEVRQPQWSERRWGHAFLGIGALMRNGKKTIKFKNSWGKDWGDGGYGYIDEEYFKSGNLFEPLVLIDKKNMSNLIKLVKTVTDKAVYLVGADGKYHPIVYEYFVLDLLGPWESIKVETVPEIPADKIGYPIGGYHR